MDGLQEISLAALAFALSVVVLILLIDKGIEYGFLWIMEGLVVFGTGAILITKYIDWRIGSK